MIDRALDIYLAWEYSERPDVAEVSAASYAILDVLLEDGDSRLVNHPWLHSYIVTARGRGPAGARHRAALAPALAGAALANALHRKLLPALFQRVLFTSAQAPPLTLGDFATRQLPLAEETVRPVLHASGSIPFVLAGERDIAGAPPGQYWDGGIIDYHFDPAAYADEGLLLYPHFRKDLTTGWFDKFLPWRRQRKPLLEQLVLLCPSDRFIASLPRGKIPDRSDFRGLDGVERRQYWRECSVRGRELADDFSAQLRAADPLAGTRRLDA